VSINNGYVMRAWYDVRWGDLEGRSKEPDESGVRASQIAINAIIEREVSRGIPVDAIVLAGFSQGGAIALQTALRYPQKLGGVMALSTYLPLAESLTKEATAQNRKTPIFMAHGSDDAVIQHSIGVRSRDALVDAGYDVEWHDYAMAHSVCLPEMGDIATWLKRELTR